jgi:hypothetical protein
MTIEGYSTILLNAVPPGVIFKATVLAGLLNQLVGTALYGGHSADQF